MEINEQIKSLQEEINEKNKALLKLKLQLGGAEVKDYTLFNKDGKETSFYSLFEDKEELLIIQNMGKSCSYCTLWADGFNGTTNHFSDRINWALISPDEPATLKEFAEGRNWQFDVYSCHNTSFKNDTGFIWANGSVAPGFSVFKKEESGKVIHHAYDWFGPGDQFSPIWHFMNYLPKGGNNWSPKLAY